MTMISCKECGKPISSNAKSCPHCGIKNKPLIGCGTLSVIGFLVFFIFTLMNSKSTNTDNSTNWKTEDNTTMAYIMMQDFVEKTLKSPSTAKFPSSYDGPKIFKLKKHQYQIESWVDAQNSFGAMIRTKFTCIVMQVDKDHWRLVSLKTHP